MGVTHLDSDIQYLKGVGPNLARYIRMLRISTIRDVLYHFPRDYEDRTRQATISSITSTDPVVVKGRITSVSSQRLRGGKVRINATLEDGTGAIELIWFNQPWIARKLQEAQDQMITAYGTPKLGQYYWQITSPQIQEVGPEDDESQGIVPIYPLSEGVSQWHVRKVSALACTHFADQLEDKLPKTMLDHFGFPSIPQAIRSLHWPESLEEAENARRRLVFEEFLSLQLAFQIKRRQIKQEAGIRFPLDELQESPQVPPGSLFADSDAPADLWQQIAAIFPFEFTSAQRRVVEEIWGDMKYPYPMNRLLQGDVGSGKTAVAASAMLACVRCGYQAAIMAPTEILAEQHYIDLSHQFESAGVTVDLLVGKMGARKRKKAMANASLGISNIIVGTHALIQEDVEFKKLGLVIIDEQHRFGVAQRAALRRKAKENPDVLVMTATPIPRTLSMTFYGDLDVSVIDELPPGRTPIKTYLRNPAERSTTYAQVKQMLDRGHQAFFVCPLISESDAMQAQAAEDLHYRLSSKDFKEYSIGLLHGGMKAEEKDQVMEAFRKAEHQVLVSTTVVEVGVNVPNATVMVIEDANRFGLSQLHQLRGRVGRGSVQSFCILIADPTNKEAERRMQVMTETTDGFRIAEEDFRLRGPGDIAGTQQSGFAGFDFADLSRDTDMIEVAKQAAIKVIESDPELKHEHNKGLKELLRSRLSEKALISVS